MGANASQITCLTIVYSIVYLCADQRKHQSSASLAFVRGIHRWPVSSPQQWPVTRKMFPFDDVIMGVPGQQSQNWPPGSLLCYMTSLLHGFIWHLVFICFGKIYCLRCMWTAGRFTNMGLSADCLCPKSQIVISDLGQTQNCVSLNLS